MGDSESNYAQTPFDTTILKITETLELDKDVNVLDKVLINRILLGCTKLISPLNPNKVKKISKSKRGFSQYDQAFAFLMGVFLLTGKSATKSEIQRQLSNATSVQQSDLYEYLDLMVQQGVKEKKEVSKPTLYKGRQTDTGVETTIKPGPHEFRIEDTKYSKMLRLLLSRPIVRSLIYCYLFESALLQQWFFSVWLLAMYRIKYYGPDHFSKLFTFSIPKDKGHILPEEEIQKFYQECKSLDEKKLREEAWNFSKKICNASTDEVHFFRDTFNYLCMRGAFLYPVNMAFI